MATSNFYPLQQASNIYAKFEFSEDLNALQDEIIEKLKTKNIKGFKVYNKFQNDDAFISIDDEEFNLEITDDEDVFHLETRTRFIITAKEGYYKGLQLDFRLEVIGQNYDFEECSYEEIKDKMWDFVEDTMWRENTKIKEQFVNYFENKTQDYYKKHYEKIDSILAEVADVILGISARFSNGETIYSRVV